MVVIAREIYGVDRSWTAAPRARCAAAQTAAGASAHHAFLALRVRHRRPALDKARPLSNTTRRQAADTHGFMMLASTLMTVFALATTKTLAHR